MPVAGMSISLRRHYGCGPQRRVHATSCLQRAEHVNSQRLDRMADRRRCQLVTIQCFPRPLLWVAMGNPKKETPYWTSRPRLFWRHGSHMSIKHASGVWLLHDICAVFKPAEAKNGPVPVAVVSVRPDLHPRTRRGQGRCAGLGRRAGLATCLSDTFPRERALPMTEAL